MLQPPPTSTLFPYTTLFRSHEPSKLHDRFGMVVDPQITDTVDALTTPACRTCPLDHESSGLLPALVAARCLSRRSEEHTSELQSRGHLVCRLLLEKKKQKQHSSNAIVAHSHARSGSDRAAHCLTPLRRGRRSSPTRWSRSSASGIHRSMPSPRESP